jgi:hypothetical protein
MKTGREFATRYYIDGHVPLLSAAWMMRFGGKDWGPTADDQMAAAKLHALIVSRITTQRLSYLHGVETAALESVYELFPTTRKIVDEFPKAVVFEELAWDVLNNRVRPFTAKWHRKSEAGALVALDSTDEFRAELIALQKILKRFDSALLDLRDAVPLGTNATETPESHEPPTDDSNRPNLPWGIYSLTGGIGAGDAQRINDAEREAIAARRTFYKLRQTSFATGLAISGGGIRSATFGLGVLVALARRGVLPQIDYLSTVSGGGYLGTFLTAFLSSPSRQPDEIGLGPEQMPFKRDDGEAAALRHVRHHSRYLAFGSLWEQTTTIIGQLFGMIVNVLAVAYVAAVLAFIELGARRLGISTEMARQGLRFALPLLGVGGILTLLAQRLNRVGRDRANWFVALPAVFVALILLWMGLGVAHEWFADAWTFGWKGANLKATIGALGAVLVSSPFIAAAAKRIWSRVGPIVVKVLLLLTAPSFFAGLYLLLYQQLNATPVSWNVLIAIVVVATLIYVFAIDINATSLHGMYRDKLAQAYIVRAAHKDGDPPEGGESILLSSLLTKPAPSPAAVNSSSVPVRGPYHLINCALNVPGSRNSAMQGRLTDFFVFSAAYCGSPLIKYHETVAWERANPQLDLATAMAISGAAAAPQMGLATIKRASFWLALLNVRLGVWVRRPGSAGQRWIAPGLRYLLKEMLGTMDERLPYLYVSDGGHIENLGVYELLRRHCRYIIAIDGEQDPGMTFQGLTTIQRLAAIDLGVKIDVDLDDLRLDAKGLSRSHFRLCRIRYGVVDGVERTGTLLYLKLSLTGNEGEFLRRYRLDEPTFPHHTTADQFFSETQFEAYRTLGEHIGDKLFLSPIVGNLGERDDVDIADWMTRLERELLEPIA